MSINSDSVRDQSGSCCSECNDKSNSIVVKHLFN